MPQATERPKPASEAAAPRGIRIERPRSERVVAAVPKLIEMQSPAAAAEIVETVDESLDDDLEIPAFLRRRAN